MSESRWQEDGQPSIVRNSAVVAILFGLFIALDYAFIRYRSSGISAVLDVIGFAACVAVPAAFWVVNRTVYENAPNRLLLRIGLVAVLCIGFFAVAILPLMWIHFALGGAE